MWSSEVSVPRRRLLRAAPLLALAGCGFQLKGEASLHFDSIALTGFEPRSPLEKELRTVLERSVTVKEAPAQAQVVFQALSEQRIRRAVAFSASAWRSPNPNSSACSRCAAAAAAAAATYCFAPINARILNCFNAALFGCAASAFSAVTAAVAKSPARS